MKLVLGSSSPYRRKLLQKLPVTFEVYSPDIDETPLTGEQPDALVERLSNAKARAVAKAHPDALIISSDQIAIFEDNILGKPGNHSAATEMLTAFSGKTVRFETGLCLYNAVTATSQYCSVPTLVHFRELSARTIEHYLQIDQPYQCAGSFQAEGLGIVLFDKLESQDPNALIGLPLIELVSMLINEGVDVLTDWA